MITPKHHSRCYEKYFSPFNMPKHRAFSYKGNLGEAGKCKYMFSESVKHLQHPEFVPNSPCLQCSKKDKKKAALISIRKQDFLKKVMMKM